jgi:hypothetical protein
VSHDTSSTNYKYPSKRLLGATIAAVSCLIVAVVQFLFPPAALKIEAAPFKSSAVDWTYYSEGDGITFYGVRGPGGSQVWAKGRDDWYISFSESGRHSFTFCERTGKNSFEVTSLDDRTNNLGKKVDGFVVGPNNSKIALTTLSVKPFEVVSIIRDEPSKCAAVLIKNETLEKTFVWRVFLAPHAADDASIGTSLHLYRLFRKGEEPLASDNELAYAKFGGIVEISWQQGELRISESESELQAKTGMLMRRALYPNVPIKIYFDRKK